MNNLEDRIDTLERSKRRYRFLIVLLFMFVISGGLAGEDSAFPDVIRAKSFEVVGDDGEVFIRLYRAAAHSHIVLLDNQEARINLMAGKHGIVVTLDDQGHYLMRTGRTQAGGGSLYICGAEGQQAITLIGTRDGGRVDVRNNKAKPIVILRSDKAGAGVIGIVGQGFNVRSLTAEP